MRISLTGRVSVEGLDGSLGGDALHRQGRLLLALLASRAGDPVPRDLIADALWSEQVPVRWEKALATLVTRLRRTLATVGLPGDSIRNAFGCYVLELPEGAVVDVLEAEHHAREAEELLADGDTPGAIAAARAGAEIARREFLPGENGGWLEGMRGGLRALLLLCLTALADASLKRGDTRTAVDALAESAELDPFRESGWLRLMDALVAAGDRAEALRVFERCRTLLGRELGVDPSPEMEELYLRILRDEQEQRAPHEPRRSERTARRLFGRDEQLQDLMATIHARQLVTIVGPGGVGKTSLAYAAAELMADQLDGSVVVAELASVDDEPGVVGVLAEAMAVTRPGPSLDDIFAAVGDGVALLVLDNCEHVLDVVTSVVGAARGAGATMSILATSRSPLGLEDEQVWTAEPLSFPVDPSIGVEAARRFPAVELFVQRATAVGETFVFDEQHVADVVEICRALDGLPLAVELAAARARVLTPAEIRARLTDRLALLRSSKPGAPDRQRSLRGLLDWSFELLEEIERRSFARLGIFAGAWTLEAAAAVCEIDETDALDVVSALVEASLVNIIHDRAGSRYRLLETIRAYALDRPGDDLTPLRERHARWFGERYAEGLPDIAAAFAFERDDLRAAVGILVEVDPERAVDVLVSTLGRWRMAGLTAEAMRRIEQVIAAGIERADLFDAAAKMAFDLGDGDAVQRYSDLMLERSRVEGTNLVDHLIGYGARLIQFGRIDDGLPYLREAQALGTAEGRHDEVVRAMTFEGDVRAGAGEVAGAEPIQQRALALAIEHDLPALVAQTQLSMARSKLRTGRAGEALALVEQALGQLRRAGDASPIANALAVGMAAAYAAGRTDRLDAFEEESSTIVDQITSAFQRAQTLGNLGELAAKRGDVRRARALLTQAIDLHRRAGFPDTATRYALAELALTVRDPTAAHRAIDAALGSSKKLMWAWPGEMWTAKGRAALQEADLDLARECLGHVEGETVTPERLALEGWLAAAEGRWDRANAIFGELTQMHGPVEHRLEGAAGHAAVALAQGDTDRAGELARSLVADAAAAGRWELACDAVVLLAARSVTLKEPERAARLLGGAERLRERTGIGIAPAELPEHQRLHEQLAVALGRTALENLWSEGRGMSQERFLAYAREAIASPGQRDDVLPEGRVFRWDGDGWIVAFDGHRWTVDDAPGMTMLHRLIASPGEQVAAAELLGDAPKGSAPEAAPGRGRASAVRAIRAAIRRLGDLDPPLGEHLASAVSIGDTCSYGASSATPIPWSV